MASDSQMIPLRDAATELGITSATLRRLIAAGEGPAVVQPGKRLLKVRRADLDLFVKMRSYPAWGDVAVEAGLSK